MVLFSRWNTHESFAAAWPDVTQFSGSETGGDNYHQVWECNMKPKPKSSVELLNKTAFPPQNNDKKIEAKHPLLYVELILQRSISFTFWKSKQFLPSRRINPGNSKGAKWSMVQGNDVMCRLVCAEEGTCAHVSAMNNLRIHSQHEDIPKHTIRISILDNQNWRRNYFCIGKWR